MPTPEGGVEFTSIVPEPSTLRMPFSGSGASASS